MTNLLPDDELEKSCVVANCTMNRERELLGSNGYDVELGFDPIDFLSDVASVNGCISWLDLCCGTGRALIQASKLVNAKQLPITITGVDLVGMFARHDESASLQLVKASLSEWKPDTTYDLITCVHGLHYIGDKLGLCSRIASWLTADGLFTGSFDVANIVVQDATSRVVTSAFRESGYEYDSQKKRLSIRGGRNVTLPFRYLGANDQAGPNYTNQPVVNSHYSRTGITSYRAG